MWQVSDDYLAALTGDHQMTVQVNVFDSGGLRAANVPIQGGFINATLLADVCRSGSFGVTRKLTDQGLFDPARDKVQILTGVEGFPPIPIFTGRVVDTVDSDNGFVQVQVEDFGRDIVQARFEQPWQASALAFGAMEIRHMIQDVDPLFGVNISRALPGEIPRVTWEEDRAGACDEVAAAINCIWQPDRTGGFDVYPNPYNLTTPAPLTLTLSDGPHGTITSKTVNKTRDNVYNSVTVLVERAGGTPPLRLTIRDENPSSKFRWGGPYGKVNRVIRLQTPGGMGEAQLMGQRILNQSLGLYRSGRISTPHFPLLDPGDVFGITEHATGDTTAQVVESVGYPLEAISETSIAWRELRYSSDDGGL